MSMPNLDQRRPTRRWKSPVNCAPRESRKARQKPLVLSGEQFSGAVKFYNVQKGFGFIVPSDGGKDLYVHASALVKYGLSVLNDGQRVLFRTGPSRRPGQFAAYDVRPHTA